MAEDHRLFDDVVANGTVFPVVDIGAADACVVDGHEDVVGRGESRLGAVFERQFLFRVEDERFVLGSGLVMHRQD